MYAVFRQTTSLRKNRAGVVPVIVNLFGCLPIRNLCLLQYCVLTERFVHGTVDCKCHKYLNSTFRLETSFDISIAQVVINKQTQMTH